MTEQQLVSVVLAVLMPAVLGLVGWVWTLWQSHHALKIKVAEEYPKTQALNDIKSDIKELRDVVYRIALKMDVPVFSEPYNR